MTNPLPALVHAIQLCPGYRKPMRPVQSAEAVENAGLTGDVHALRDSSRQVLLLEKETLDDLALLPGQVKENITTIGIGLMALRTNDRLRIGAEVVLEITKPCSPCSRMEETRPGLLRLLAGRRGMLARVVRGGTIAPGDPIRQIGGGQ